MDALIKISSSEFNEEVFKKIKSLISSFENAEITIAVSSHTGDVSRHETKKEYWARLEKSISDIRNGKGTSFTMEELEANIQLGK